MQRLRIRLAGRGFRRRGQGQAVYQLFHLARGQVTVTDDRQRLGLQVVIQADQGPRLRF
ncbi:hypothetical protein [Candidatus Amarobacter glycogenicus]|uniref:hypothetical protein n=1 Tax=Candidatus Amarobacter glycogenicus TaxID=3140699 RepID=UPI0031CC3BFF